MELVTDARPLYFLAQNVGFWHKCGMKTGLSSRVIGGQSRAPGRWVMFPVSPPCMGPQVPQVNGRSQRGYLCDLQEPRIRTACGTRAGWATMSSLVGRGFNSPTGRSAPQHLQTRHQTLFQSAFIKLRFLELRPVLRDNQRVNSLSGLIDAASNSGRADESMSCDWPNPTAASSAIAIS